MTTYTSDNGSAIHIVCDCHSAEHQIYFVHDEDPEFEYFYISIHLTAWENWFRRLWAGIRYIFGHRSKYGDWDEIILNIKDARKLVDFLNSKLPMTDVPPVAGVNDA